MKVRQRRRRYRRLGAGLAVVLAMAAVAPGAVASNPSAEQALGELNVWRAQAGENPVGGLDANLSEGCRLHNAYMAQNGGLDHSEDPTKPGYTPLGAQAGSSSVLSTGELGPREAWEDAVYHRMGLLAPRLVSTSFDASSGFTCMGEFGISSDPSARTPSVTPYPWPANGMRGVPTNAGGGESPDPAAAVPGASALGYLLSVDVNGPWWEVDGSTLIGASLTPDGGSPVAATGVDRNSPNGWALDGGIGIFPNQPLMEGTWYTAHAVGMTAGVDLSAEVGAVTSQLPFDVTWRFQTKLKDPSTEHALSGGTVSVETASPAAVHVSVTRAGTLVTQRDMANGQRWATGVMPGTYQVCFHQEEVDPYAGHDSCDTMIVDGRTVVSGRITLHRGLVTVTAVVVPSAHQQLAVTLARPRTCRRHAQYCLPWKVFKTVNSTAAVKRVVRVRVSGAERRIQVTVSVAGATIGGGRYLPTTAIKTVRPS